MILYPKCYLKSVKEITIEMLEKNQIKGIILDVDNTLIDYYRKMPEGVLQWCKNLKQAGIQFFIASNSNKKDKVETVANTLSVPYLYFAKKPLKIGFRKAQHRMGLPAKNIAVVGDQIFTDILGANRCKMYSILVEPIEEKDLWITVIKRPIENKIKQKFLQKH